MAEQIVPWLGLVVLLPLCLPIPSVQRGVLTIASWALRLALILLLGAGAYLTLQPGDVPPQLTAIVADFPSALGWLPPVGSPAFGLSLACVLVAPLIPLLAAIDVAKQAARWAQQALPKAVPATTAPPADGPSVPATTTPPADAQEPLEAMPQAQEIEEPLPVGVPLLRPIERREAAGALASAARRAARSEN
ncbi:MAG: hypothetical protein RMJ56_11605 [Gemmataceae bacterium]|nr:hypothetical protein [Gemmata sp.]MDW8198237.1 hypothetical protein [Gemmataceae bacterium]